MKFDSLIISLPTRKSLPAFAKSQGGAGKGLQLANITVAGLLSAKKHGRQAGPISSLARFVSQFAVSGQKCYIQGMNTKKSGELATGHDHDSTPRIVSLDRSVTDILVHLGTPPVNSYWWQLDLSAAEMAEYQPDMVICGPASLPEAKAAGEMMDRSGLKVPEIVVCQTDSLGSGIATIRKLGLLLGRETRAAEIVRRENSYLKTARNKAKTGYHAPSEKPKCLIILDLQQDSPDGQNIRFLACGKDSFQAGILRIAGGATAGLATKGQKDLANWTDAETISSLAPGFVFATNAKIQGKLTESLAGQVAEKTPAVANWQVMCFPEEMLGYFSCSYGYICLWLASTIHPGTFADRQGLLKPDNILARREIALPDGLGASAELLEARLYDLPARTILLRTDSPRMVLSSLDGWRSGISWIGNHECPHPAWPLLARLGMKKTRQRVLALHGLPETGTCLLHTGADISKFSLCSEQSGPFTVSALATAGVLFNALRAGCDSGQFVEAGTINLILLTNASLARECLVQCLVQATEAKVAAMQSLDIRSCQSGLQATGTGTDNCIVVSGTGSPATMAGGHTRLGELVARASYHAVREAICSQHGFGPDRPLPQRLRERGIVWKPEHCRVLEKNKIARAIVSAGLAIEDGASHDLVAEPGTLLEWISKKPEDKSPAWQAMAGFLARLANAQQNRYCDRPKSHRA